VISSRGAIALLAAFLLSACAGIIPQAPERPGDRAAPREEQRDPPATSPQSPAQSTGHAPPRAAEPSGALPALPDPSLPPLPPADYRYDPSPVGFVRHAVSPDVSNAAGLGARRGPAIASLAIGDMSVERAFHAFRISCPIVINRQDLSGLTASTDWVEPCRRAASWPAGQARRFFDENFTALEVGSGQAFATGYYEPEIAASRTRRPGYDRPIYGVPADLLRREPPHNGSEMPTHYRLADGQERAYFTRAEIEGGALAGRGLEIAWARDPVDLFFFHIQGGGLLRLPDGSAMRLSYATHNGYDYQSIGALMRERGLLDPGQTTSQGIQAWLRAHPEEGRRIMNENPRYIFYEESSGPAATGSMSVYVTPRATVAADMHFVPRGAPVFLDVDHDIADGLWVAQDSGGAITGANRFDTFWGAGDAAHRVAGGMSARGSAYVLVPNAAAARITGR